MFNAEYKMNKFEQIKNKRGIFIHGYFDIDYEVVWKTFDELISSVF
ncbi:MAG: HepT-like ribonuclease domain-containing protein [bacterium]